ncbi:3-hydroxyacyl-CoA dehydrogenase family protein [Thermoleophilum album]|uniref:3-hydroxybutyryl-CoA dehydrogenase n=1 Tax=Thermoleophilum album TaxID=29539 RepID=A0A1H6FRI9_THEAL|nr:3-hydroxyacyl-CoA dehydrogenase family protein [Thermoleophilum album]SEH12483.1 3-hydroxybutyryl-CoA dehydrogenase [Thermoleophilum album]
MANERTEKLGIVGSGTIGAGLARAAADAGIDVLVWARVPERARARLKRDLPVTNDLAALADRELVVESVAEELETKRELLGRLDAALPADTVLASTTSSLSVAELARASGRPERFGALHVFNPVEKMKLVELAFPAEASEETRSLLHGVCEQLGKVAVEVPDVPGFVVNRLLFPYLFDAVRLLEETGLEPQAIDTCMKLGAGHPMGPLALLDFVGLDVSAAIGESIGVEIPPRVRELIAQGRLGRKTKAGFYEYE